MFNNSDFAHLHNHTEHSLLDGVQKVEDLVKTCSDKGFAAVAITDHGNVNGAVKLFKQCQEQKIQPILGCELYLTDEIDSDKIRKHNYHLTVLAKNAKGFASIMKALTLANTKWKNSWKPFIPVEYPLEHMEDVVVLSGCASSPFWKMADVSYSADLLKRYVSKFEDDFYFEIMPNYDWSGQYTVNANAVDMSKEYNKKLVVTSDSHYCKKEDHKMHSVILAMQTKQRWNNPSRFKFSTEQSYIKDADNIVKDLCKMQIDAATAAESAFNTIEVAEKCKWSLKKIPVTLPKILETDEEEEVLLYKLCKQGMSRRDKAGEDAYRQRLDNEIAAIMENGFTRYFLIVADVVRWCKENGILVGPARGSVASSVAAWFLGITDVDPLYHGLIFERFISKGRASLPDIDLDIDDQQRYLVIKYLQEKYGAKSVAYISTFGRLRGKQAIRDISRVFDVPISDVNEVSKLILHRLKSDPRVNNCIEDSVATFDKIKEFKSKYPDVVSVASKVEGLAKNLGVHAAGVIIHNGDLYDGSHCTIVDSKKGSTVNWDKDDAEYMGLMKLDILGLNTLGVISECLKLIKQRRGIDIVLHKLPLDDAKTYDALRKGDTITSFQINTKGMQQLCRDIKCDDFNTLRAVSALYRPGCLKAGITERYVRCRQGQQKPEYVNDIHKEITKDTYGHIVYQEQVMFLLHRMANMPWEEVDKIRKVIGKSEGVEKWTKYEKAFINGCKKAGTLDASQAKKIFDELRFFAQYAFNLSHATGYGLLSYYTVYLKENYPEEWYCAYFNNCSRGDKGKEVSKLDEASVDARKKGVKLLQPDVNASGIRWVVEDKMTLRAGLIEVRNMGENAQRAVAEAKITKGAKFLSLIDFVNSVKRQAINKAKIKSLVLSGAMNSLLGEDVNIWKLYFDDLYSSVLSSKKLEEKLSSYRIQTTELTDDEKEKIDRLEADNLNYDMGRDEYSNNKRLILSLSESVNIKKLSQADYVEFGEDKKWYTGLITEMKYNYAGQGKSGIGSAYGIIRDESGHKQLVCSDKLVNKKTKMIESLEGRAVLTLARCAEKSNKLVAENMWTFEDIAKGDFNGLKKEIIKPIEDMDWSKQASKTKACTLCKLRATCKAPVPLQPGTLNAFIVGEAPGKQEDEQGRPFVGDSGDLLFQLLQESGFEKSLFHLSNTIACRPPKNQHPGITYSKKCPHLEEQWNMVKPKLALCLGNQALWFFKGVNKGISALNGTTEWNNKRNCWVTFSIHPLGVLYDNNALPIFERGIAEFIRMLKNLT